MGNTAATTTLHVTKPIHHTIATSSKHDVHRLPKTKPDTTNPTNSNTTATTTNNGRVKKTDHPTSPKYGDRQESVHGPDHMVELDKPRPTVGKHIMPVPINTRDSTNWIARVL